MNINGWYRLLLSLLLLVVVTWFWWSRIDELLYHTISSSELIEIGDATSASERIDGVPKNSYVTITGILGNKAATITGLRAGSLRFGRNQIRHLLGSKIYIEFEQEKYLERFSPFTRITVKGRLVSFGPGSELNKVRTFFKDYYNQPVDDLAMLIVVDEEPKSEPIYVIAFFISCMLVGISFFASIRLLRRPRAENDYEERD